MFRSMNSNVSTVSSFVSKGPIQTLHLQRPLAHKALCCRSGLSLNKDLIENIVCQNYGASTGWECGKSRSDRMRAYLSDFEISYLRASRFSFGVW